MKLPLSGYAIVSRRKVRDYLLASDHPLGRHKAAFFHSLGYTQNRWRVLAEKLLEMAKGDIVRITSHWSGQRYEIRGELVGLNGRKARLVTIWMVRSGERRARLVTAYPED